MHRTADGKEIQASVSQRYTHISPVTFPEGELQEVTLVTLEFNPSAMLSSQVPSIKLFQTSLKLSYQRRQHFLC